MSRKPFVVIASVIAGLTLSVAFVVPIGAVTLDEEIFDSCGDVDLAVDVKPSAGQVRTLAKAFAGFDERAAKRRIASALKEADDTKSRRRAVSAARDWCDGAGAYEITTLTLGIPTALDIVDSNPAVLTGSSTPGATVTARYIVIGGPKSVATTANPAGAFSVAVLDLPMGDTTVTMTASSPLHYDAPAQSVRVRRIESEGAFKASTREIPSDELKKDPAGLKGSRIYARAEVFQYDARTGLTSMLAYVRVVNPGRFEFWTDPVLLRLETAAQGAGIDEDDIIEFWGEVDGPYSYSTAIGGSNTVPAVKVKYLGLIEKK